MAEHLSPVLQELKRCFIVPNDAVIMPNPVPRRQRRVSNYYYCPYAPCCSECTGIFTFREVLKHLVRTHEKSAAQIKQLVKRGLPGAPERGERFHFRNV